MLQTTFFLIINFLRMTVEKMCKSSNAFAGRVKKILQISVTRLRMLSQILFYFTDVEKALRAMTAASAKTSLAQFKDELGANPEECLLLPGCAPDSL